MQWWTVIGALALVFISIVAQEVPQSFNILLNEYLKNNNLEEKVMQLSPTEREEFTNELYKRFREKYEATDKEKREKSSQAEKHKLVMDIFDQLFKEAAEEDASPNGGKKHSILGFLERLWNLSLIKNGIDFLGKLFG